MKTKVIGREITIKDGLKIKYPRAQRKIKITGGDRPTSVGKGYVKYLGKKSIIKQIDVGSKARGIITSGKQTIAYQRTRLGLRARYISESGELIKTKFIRGTGRDIKALKVEPIKVYTTKKFKVSFGTKDKTVQEVNFPERYISILKQNSSSNTISR